MYKIYALKMLFFLSICSILLYMNGTIQYFECIVLEHLHGYTPPLKKNSVWHNSLSETQQLKPPKFTIDYIGISISLSRLVVRDIILSCCDRRVATTGRYRKGILLMVTVSYTYIVKYIYIYIINYHDNSCYDLRLELSRFSIIVQTRFNKLYGETWWLYLFSILYYTTYM